MRIECNTDLIKYTDSIATASNGCAPAIASIFFTIGKHSGEKVLIPIRRHHTFFVGLTLLALLSSACPDQASGWRSVLFPSNWTPAFTAPDGHFLHDFSYAGYHNGDQPLPLKSGSPQVSIVDFGADPTGSADSTEAIQQAIDSLTAGGVVMIPTGLYRCDDVLSITTPGTVLRGAGPNSSRIYFTRSSGMTSKGHITFRGNVQRETDILLAEDGVSRSHFVKVADAGSLTVGDEISVGWVITDAFVEEHGMTGTWQAFNGQWRSFFKRTITEIDQTATPHTITLDVPLRYSAKLRDAASLRRESGFLAECGIELLGIATAVDWDAAWEERLNHAVLMTNVKDCWIDSVESFQSPNPDVGNGGFHLQCSGIKIFDSKRVTITGCSMQKPQNRGGGGSGYLYEISRVNEVLIRDSVAIGGRHNFIQNWDFGTSGCVFLRCTSSGGHALTSKNDPIGYPGFCEYHHSLAMANLVDNCTIRDGWFGGNRNAWSSGAGHSVTQSVYWNTLGGGILSSWQYGNGYIIGTEGMIVVTAMIGDNATGTGPADYREGINEGNQLSPTSLYDAQLARRNSLP